MFAFDANDKVIAKLKEVGNADGVRGDGAQLSPLLALQGARDLSGPPTSGSFPWTRQSCVKTR